MLHFGVREHAMAAIVNGLSLSKLRAFGATFFIFSDYARPALRLSALMELPTFMVFTHDAMGDGEDGPTHQPVEHLISLRAVPGLVVLRPGATPTRSSRRTATSCNCAIRPALIVLTRQPLPTLDRGQYASAAGVARGAYVMADAPGGTPEIILIASGSEVTLAVEAHETLIAQGIRSRVVSMPSWDIFEHQPQSYRDSVLPPGVRRASRSSRARPWAGTAMSAPPAEVIGMKTFGASAPLKALLQNFGFEPDRVVATVKELLGGKRAHEPRARVEPGGRGIANRDNVERKP